MKKVLGILVVIVATISFGSIASAEYYTVNVKRVDQDLYKTNSGLYIQTNYCYEYSYGEDAILKYDDYSYDNKLIFDSGNSCDVTKIFK